MPQLMYQLGPLSVTVRYLWQKHAEGPYYYRRRVPKHAISFVGKKVIQQSLKTRDRVLAAKRVVALARRDDEQWYALESGLTPETDREKAVELLESIGLAARPIEEQRERQVNYDVFIDRLDRKVIGYDHPSQHLDGAELRALDILKGVEKFYLSDAKRLYLKKRDGIEIRDDNRKLRNTTENSFDLVFSSIGDRELGQYRRRDISEAIETAIAGGLKTSTVRRRLSVVRASVNELIKEYELNDQRNPFSDFEIPKFGEDGGTHWSST